jgi:hypothetical protein
MKLHYHIFILILFASLNVKAQIIKTTTIKGIKYIGNLSEEGFSIIDLSQSVILHLSNQYFDFTFQDFNNDGCSDILLEWEGNVPERYSLFLYKTKNRRFEEVLNFSNFPAPKFIKGTKYLYSYRRAGCADESWASDLFFIQNNSTVRVGDIKGDGCGTKKGIYISKVHQAKEFLLNTLPLGTIQKYKDNKFGFINQYWNKNWKIFR